MSSVTLGTFGVTLDTLGFRDWLKSQDGDAILGCALGVMTNPISQYLESQNPKVCFAIGPTTIAFWNSRSCGSMRQPNWVHAFRRDLDITHPGNPPITVADARRALRRVMSVA